MDQSDRPLYRYPDYLRAPSEERWSAFASAAPEDALAMVLINPPDIASPYLPALNLLEEDSADRLYIISLAEHLDVRLENVVWKMPFPSPLRRASPPAASSFPPEIRPAGSP